MRSAPRSPLLLLALLALTACGRDHARVPGAATAEPPPTLPTGTVLEIASDDLGALLTALQGQFRDPAAGVPIPESATEVVEHWIALPEQIRRHIPAEARLRALYLEVEGGTRSAVAVRLRLERDAAHPLGMEVTVVPGGPHGAKWLIGRPAGSGPLMALLGDVLVVADDRPTLEASLRWLGQKRMSEDVGPGLVVRLPRGAIGGFLRQLADGLVEEHAGQAIASARAERAQHAEDPALGDPEQVVVTVRDRLRRLLAYFPDAGEATLRLSAGPNGVVLDGTSAVEPRSPLARALSEARVGRPFGLGALPRTTAIAVATRRAPSETPWIDVLGPIAGGRMSGPERAALAQAGERLHAMRGDGSVVAVGAHEDGPFVLAGFEPGTTLLEPAAVGSVLAVPYVGGAIGSIIGCERLQLGGLASGHAALCRTPEPPTPDLTILRGERASAVLVAARPASPTTPHGAANALVGAPDRVAPDGLFGDPDGERALSSLGEDVFFAMALSGGALMPSLGIVGSPGLRRFAAGRPLPTSPHPILFALRREAGNLGVRVVATPRAIEETWSVVYLANAFLGGE